MSISPSARFFQPAVAGRPALPVPAGAAMLSTDGLQRSDTAPAWGEWMSRLFNGLESDTYGDAVFEGRLATARAGTLMLTRLQANRHRVYRRQGIGSDSDAGYLKIVAPWRGSAVVEQHGRQACTRSGNWAIYDTSCRYSVANPEASDHLIIMLPRSALAERGLRLDSLMGRSAGGAGIARVALETMRSTFQELPHMSPEAASGAGSAVTELVYLALLDMAGHATGESLHLAFQDRIRAFVGQHLRDPGLTLERIASGLNCSKRHLHNAFAAEEHSLAQYIQRRRLQACMQALHDPALAHLTITDIAFSWGFSNGAHFSRVFREHAGMTPSEYRRGQAGALAGAD